MIISTIPERNIVRFVDNNKDLESIKQLDYNQNNDLKPVGLWYAINDEWLDWVSRVNFYGNRLILDENNKYVLNDLNFYQVKLEDNLLTKLGDKDKSKILVLSTREEKYEFHNKYCITNIILDKFKILDKLVNWKQVTDDYGGIEIRNYSTDKWELISTMSWHYALDASSGCIWNNDILKKVKLENIELINKC